MKAFSFGILDIYLFQALRATAQVYDDGLISELSTAYITSFITNLNLMLSIKRNIITVKK